MTSERADRVLEPTDAFALLSNEVRLSILWALFDSPAERASFSEIRARLDVSDPGHINYHLNELRPHFVERTTDGYTLQRPGYTAVRLLYSGEVTDTGMLEPHDLPGDCVRCQGSVQLRYDDGFALVYCTDCTHWFVRYVFAPGALEDRSIDEIATVLDERCRMIRRFGNRGICPMCNASMTSELTDGDCFGHDVAVEYRCERCGCQFDSTVGAATVSHPAIVAFCHEHGIDVRERRLWELDFAFDPAALTVLRTRPWRVSLGIEYGSERLTLELDEDLGVVATHRR
jgi:hypothetical protein